MMNRALFLATSLALATAACGSSKNEPETPPQGYYQQQPAPMQPAPAPMQPAPAPMQPAPAPAATAPAPAATTPAPAASSSATPTAIPGVMKNADGTCSITPPGGQPLTGPCPPGL